MKFGKFTFSIFLIFGLLISTISPSVVFAVDTIDYSGAISRMKQLGVLDSSISDDTKIITRGQFAKAIVVVDNLIDTASAMEGSTVFPDVAANSELSGYVNVLMNKQLITGMADGKFHAEAAVAYSEISTVLVKLLGYSESDLTGTWPSNFLSKASNLKLTSNLTFKKNDKVTIRNAALIFDRFLNTEIKSQSTNSADKVTFLSSTNVYSDCIVYENSYTSSNLAGNEVLTDQGVLYSLDDATKLQVGETYRVKLEDGEIIKVYGKAKDTVKLSINNMIGNTISYNENGEEKSMTLPSSINYYYHGVKQNFENLSNLLQINMTIIFTYNNNSSYSYAVIADPIYSKPEVASNFNPLYNKLGDITFDSNIKIIKNGEAITKKDIKDMDVVYNVTDMNGENRYILVIENYTEGNIKAFLADGHSPTGIQIDSNSYNYDKNMQFSKLQYFSTGDLVALLLGHDGKVIDIKNIQQKTGNLVECIILGDYRTSDDLASDEVLTDKGTFTFTGVIDSLEIGVKYQLYVSENVVTKINKKVNSTENYAVTEIAGSDMEVKNDNNTIVSMKLPKASVYYYHGEKISYYEAISSITAFSSIILSKSSNGNSYDYAVIVDPYFSEPKMFMYSDTEFLNTIKNSGFKYIYRDEMYIQNPYSINDKDIIYFVSDVWNRNCYIYANDTKAYGYIQGFSPSKVNANSIKVNGETYELSKYLDKTKFKNYYTGGFIRLYLGVDGKVVNIE